ncbi:hypothetical protein EXIGLDRAFT_772405 [Exidia glandulosa HHB12029]|uniref:Uncharacterized protein n=1 Tax=Exidia glandulosa HHB12029 TaxID=1314781 RepID=A0A165FBQ0_EXIGL|nr:hypothetical protein EXIGLDRAFT_772405 [Exidia glandulosa HHB12029]
MNTPPSSTESPKLRRFDPTRDKLDPGQIVVVECSVKEPILKAIKAHHATARPTASMLSFTQRLREDLVDLKARPCLVVRRSREGLMIVPLATFEDSLITDLDLHTQHFAVAVGDTRAWPPGRETLSIAPDWPDSRLKPVYALAKEILINNRRFGGLYEYWERDEKGRLLRDNRGNVIRCSDFRVEESELQKFEQLIRKIARQYRALTPGQRALYNRSWDEAEQRLQQTRADSQQPAGNSRDPKRLATPQAPGPVDAEHIHLTQTPYLDNVQSARYSFDDASTRSDDSNSFGYGSEVSIVPFQPRRMDPHMEMWLDMNVAHELAHPQHLFWDYRHLRAIERAFQKRFAMYHLANEPQTSEWLRGVVAAGERSCPKVQSMSALRRMSLQAPHSNKPLSRPVTR